MAGFDLAASVAGLLSSFGFGAGFDVGVETVLGAGDGLTTSERNKETVK